MDTEVLKARPFSKVYHCEICDKHMHLTPIEILRHKKTHEGTESQLKYEESV